jgi:transposase-like protein
MGKKEIETEAIIAEYLVGESSYRKLGIKYGVDFRNVHSWVMKYQGRSPKPTMKLKQKKEEEAPLSNEVKQLQQELRKAQLHNKLLNAMIDIAEDQLKIDIRKKSGTKR